ncbi:MAG: glycosyltransferase family 39 protein [Chloroflexi bacterium]|nr:glycosyltransferase family 39 protein [Chloroflexota bacterium]
MERQLPAPSPPIEAAAALARPILTLSGEALLYGLALLVAAALRLALAGRDPLAPSETATALAALDLVAGRSQPGGTPLAEVLSAFVFFIAGGSDLAARLPAVLAGVGTVAVLPLFRPLLGRRAALLAAFLLAVSPFALGISRRLDSESFALFGALLVTLGVFRFLAEGRLGWLVLAIVTLGPLLATGPGALTFVLALATAGAAARLAGLQLFSVRALWQQRESQAALGWAALAALLLYLTCASRVFLDGRGLALPALRAWVEAFSGGGSLVLPLVALLSYEPLALVFGVAGAVRLLRSSPGGEPRQLLCLGFLAVWSAVALGVALLGGQRLVGPLASVTLPLTLLTATVLADLLHRTGSTALARGGAIIGVLPLMVFAAIQSAVLLRAQVDAGPQWLAVWLSLVLAAGYALLVLSAGGRAALPPVALAGAGLLLLGTVHASFQLNARPTAAEWVLAEIPGPAATLFPATLAELQADRGGVLLYGVSPSLRVPFGWYLRDLPGQVLTDQLQPGLGALIVAAGNDPPGATVVQRATAAAGTFGPPEGWRAFWRWYVWREGLSTSFERQTVLLTP